MAELIPGTSVNITPPNGYVAADDLPGFRNITAGSFIRISEIPGLYSEVTNRFSEDRMQTLGMTLLSKSPVNVYGYKGVLLHTEFSFQDTQFKSWMLLVDRSESTTIIEARYPKASSTQGKLLKPAILEAILGNADPTARLTYSVTPLAPFKVGMVLEQLLILSPNGHFPINDENIPNMFMWLSECEESTIPDKKAFSESQLVNSETIRNINVSEITPVTIGNLSGYTVKATGEGHKAAIPLTIYQVLLFGTSEYYVIQGITPRAENDTYLPIFEKMAKSFRIKELHNQ